MLGDIDRTAALPDPPLSFRLSASDPCGFSSSRPRRSRLSA